MASEALVSAQHTDRVVIYFGTDANAINAYTLATALIKFADAARRANALINPGYEIEVTVESLKDGSFKAVLKAVYKSTQGLFSKESAHAIVLGVISSMIYDAAFHKDAQITINTDEVIIEEEGRRLVIPRIVYDKKLEVEKSDTLKAKVSEIIDSVRQDDEVKVFGVGDADSAAPPLTVPTQEYRINSEAVLASDENSRIIFEDARLEILKAILEESSRKWEFLWNGIKISGPVTDKDFYQRFFRHEIRIAPGDVLSVKMRVFQSKHSGLNVFVNERYEIFEVMSHEPHIKENGMEI